MRRRGRVKRAANRLCQALPFKPPSLTDCARKTGNSAHWPTALTFQVSHPQHELATSATSAIGAAVRDDPAATRGVPEKGTLPRRGADRRNFLLMSELHLKVPQWLSPREKPRRPSGTCAAAIMRSSR